MTDKEKIREEVQRLMNELIQEKQKGYGSDVDDACILELQNVLTYIDSLQEEHEFQKAGGDGMRKVINAINTNLSKEPVSEDLEEAADNALSNVLNTHEIVNVRSCLEMFRFGAEWQKKQDQETIELAEDHAMFAGMEKMKEQMMAKAIDAHCFGFQGAALFSFKLPADNYLIGSEVKVIVIKEN